MYMINKLNGFWRDNIHDVMSVYYTDDLEYFFL